MSLGAGCAMVGRVDEAVEFEFGVEVRLVLGG